MSELFVTGIDNPAWREARELPKTRQAERERRVKRDDGADSQRKKIFETLAGEGVNNIEQCLAWAFGYDYDGVPMDTWPERWNKIHFGLMVIRPEDNLEDVFKRIGRGYQKMVNAHYDRILRNPVSLGEEKLYRGY